MNPWRRRHCAGELAAAVAAAWWAVSLCLSCATIVAQEAVRFSGPWDLPRLKEAPAATWGPVASNQVRLPGFHQPQVIRAATWGPEASNQVREVYYDNVPFRGRSTRVFGYCAYPTNSLRPNPALLLVHGGGMHADPGWALAWANRGYVALAIDLTGEDKDGRLPDGGPAMNEVTIFDYANDPTIGNAWVYHAVAAVVRGLSLLRAQPEVIAGRIGVHGLSWGGVITCIVAGIDHRISLAVPVFGAGYLYEDSVWASTWFAWMTCDQRTRWIHNFDPSRYLPGVSCPILFVSGTGDPFFPPKGFQRSSQLVPGAAFLSVRPRFNHGWIWQTPWTEIEIARFIGAEFQADVPLPSIAPMRRSGDQVSATISSQLAVAECRLWYTTELGPWKDRHWQSQSVPITEDVATASLPVERPLSYYFALTDAQGAFVSAPIVEAGADDPSAVLRFTQITSQSTGLELRGNKLWGHWVVLQGSTNNCVWLNVSTNDAAGDTFTFLVPNRPESTPTLYRARDLDW